MAPLIAELRRRSDPSDRPLHLVFVPAEGLALVPWHATWMMEASVSRKYILDDTLVSYVPSGRILVEASRRSAQPRDGSALLVGNPTGDLPNAGLEAQELVDCYPRALHLGAVGEPNLAAARPKHVLAAMPSAEGPGLPVLHLACHGQVGASPIDSQLLLAESEPLNVAQLLSHSAGRDPSAAGPIVVLSACETNLALDDLDEAVTLSTAFLVAGASSVIGTLWPIDDLRSAAIMRVMHHFLTIERSPAAALRAAQKWAADERRTVPSDTIASSAVDAVVLNATDLADPLWWAGFTHQGR